MNLEEIMKPYFDKKEAFDKKYIEGKSVLELRLARLRDNKESEIEEYIQNAVAERPGFYAGYGAMIRQDLEQSYARRETELEEELKNYDKFYRLDVREVVSTKEDVRKELISARKDIELQLREVQINSDVIMLKLSRFEPIYDENYNVVNGDERKQLFDESHRLIEVKYNLEKQLEQIKEYLDLTQVTKEETSVLMMSLTPWEQEEYDRRKAIVAEVQNVEISEEIPTKEPVVEIVEETPIVEEIPEAKDPKEEIIGGDDSILKTDLEKIEEEPEIVPEEEQMEDGVILVDSFKDLLEQISSDVLSAAKKTRLVSINGKQDRFLTTLNEEDESYQYAGKIEEDNVNLPNGSYINKRDVFNALDNYRKQNKGRVFKVKGYNATFEINRKTIRLVKEHLRECSTIKLVREKKLGHFDLKRVYGKVGADKYIKLAEGAKTNIASGKYINLDELYNNLGDLFKEKSPRWFERFKNKLNRKPKTKEIEINKYDQNQLEWDDDYIIKTK